MFYKEVHLHSRFTGGGRLLRYYSKLKSTWLTVPTSWFLFGPFTITYLLVSAIAIYFDLTVMMLTCPKTTNLPAHHPNHPKKLQRLGVWTFKFTVPTWPEPWLGMAKISYISPSFKGWNPKMMEIPLKESPSPGCLFFFNKFHVKLWECNWYVYFCWYLLPPEKKAVCRLFLRLSCFIWRTNVQHQWQQNKSHENH